MSHRRFFTTLALLCVTLGAGLLLSLPALAAGPAAGSAPAENGPRGFAFQTGCPVTVTVTSAADDGAGTLRRALADVCDGGTIDFAPGLAGQTIGLTSAELAIDKTVTITNPQAPGLAVSGNAARQVFYIGFTGVVTLSQLSIVSGTGSMGGGVYNDGRLTVSHSTLSGNSADGWGGGIYNGGTLTVVNSTLSGNSAELDGGGIRNDGTLTVQNSTLSGNSARSGGGIFNIGTLSVQNSILSGNSADSGGGVFNDGTLTVVNSTLSGNSAEYGGGGVYNNNGTLIVQNSTLSGNSANSGGGIDNYNAPLTVQNSTLSDNSSGLGGGIANAFGTLTLTATIIANSPSGRDCFNSGGTIAADHNLIEATGGDACGLTDGVDGNIVGVDPLLSPLGAYGGPSVGSGQAPGGPSAGPGLTFALLPGSRAIDAGLNCLAADQRGVSRPQPGGGACDIGAFESRGFVLTYGGGSGQSAVVNTAFAAPLTLTASSAYSEPVDGGVVTFAGPLSGAGVDPVTTTATIAGGVAARVVAANGVLGGPYTVVARAAGTPASVSYALTNTVCLAQITVRSTADDGAGTLRQAIATVCGGGTIDFAPGLAGQTIGLTSAELAISRTVTITNPQAPGLAISGNAARRVFAIQATGVATLSQLSIVSGTVTGGSSCPTYCGGGIYVESGGRLAVQSSTLAGNSAGFGGGMYISGTLTVQNSTLSGNSATFQGGGIENSGTLTVRNSTLSGNSAVGYGGGIDNNNGALTVQNSTLSGNSASFYGGGIENGGTLTMTNTIIANSPSGGDCRNRSSIAAADHNLVEGNGNACGLTGGAGGNIVGVDPLLSPLGAYGGPSAGPGLTFALLPGSRALDAGLNCLAADQRGVSRPQPGGGTCDIGAFESRGFALAYGGGGGQSALVNTAFAAPLTLTVSSAYTEPVDGGVVTFGGPLSGAGVTPITTTATIAAGVATRVITANSVLGGPYTVVARAAGAPASVSYALTNICPAQVTVTSAADDGAGTLRRAIAEVCGGGTIDFAPGLAGQTIGLTSAELAISRTVTITNPQAPGLAVSGNAARRVFNIQSSGVATLSQLSIVSGTATGGTSCFTFCGGGIYNDGTLTVVNSTLSGNSARHGGGVSSEGTLTVQNSTLSGNSADSGGGGIDNVGTLSVQNSTLSGNSAQYEGGGIGNFGTLTMQNSTLSGNSAAAGSGGGVYNTGLLNLANTIIAGSPSGGDCHDYYGVIAADHSLIEATGGDACGLTGGAGGNIVGVDPLLGPLGAYGGPSAGSGSGLTFALLPGSRAIDAGLNCLAADQRGVSRPQPGGGACDIGAFESRGFALTYGGGSGQSALVNTAFAAPLTLTASSAYTEPVDGGVVTFGGPPSGAGVDPVTATATISGGVATQAITANGTAGSYTVSAGAAGAPAGVGFDLTNALPAPAMAVLGNGAVIAVGDTTPAEADDTDFGSAPVSGGQITHTFTISNGGTADLNLTGTPAVAISGPAAGDFTLVGSPALSLTAGSTTTFQVCFTPSVTGTRVATLTIANDDPARNPYDFAVQGTGAPAAGGTLYIPIIYRAY